MNDFQSAAQTQRLVAALAQLYALRSDDDKHKVQATALRTACDKVGTTLRTKNAEASRKALKDCDDLVATARRIARRARRRSTRISSRSAARIPG